MPNDLAIAIAVAIALSFLIAIIEIKQKSDADLLTCVSGFFLVYFIILSFGNSLTTLVASASLTDFLPAGNGDVSDGAKSMISPAAASVTVNNPAEKSALILPGPRWLWYASVGVFGFEVILKNLNVTMFGKGVLTINDWIQKAQNITVSEANKSHSIKSNAKVTSLANALRNKLSDTDLKTYAVAAIGDTEVQQLVQSTSATGGDEKLALGLAIASDDADNARAIIDAS